MSVNDIIFLFLLCENQNYFLATYLDALNVFLSPKHYFVLEFELLEMLMFWMALVRYTYVHIRHNYANTRLAASYLSREKVSSSSQ